MSILMLEVAGHFYLKGEQVGEKTTVIRLSNGKQIKIEQDVLFKGVVWPWKIDDQHFSGEGFARSYLRELVWEKMTGKRMILHSKGKVPDICGVNGAACRCPEKCSLALCHNCPIAEEFFAKRDGVELVYVV